MLDGTLFWLCFGLTSFGLLREPSCLLPCRHTLPRRPHALRLGLRACHPNRSVPPGLDNFLNHLAFDERKPLITAQVRVGELVLIEAELVQNRGVNVAEVEWFF